MCNISSMSCDWLDPQRSRMTKSMSSSGVSSCYSEMDMDHLHEDASDEEDAFISFTTTESRCEQLYQEGLELKHSGDHENSLTSFLKCLEGMQECQYFVKLPQTLHQLSVLSRSLQDLQGAEEYEKAERLFYEATAVESPPQAQTKEGGAKHKKRKPFSKRPKPAISVCNPAEYGNILISKSDDYERLARVCAKENKFSDALDHCSKAVSIKQCVFGRNHHSTLTSMDYLTALHTEASIFEASTDGMGAYYPPDLHPKGDLSTAERAGPRNENGSTPSAECGGAHAHLLATTADNSTPQCTLSNTHLHHPKDSFTQTETTFPFLGSCKVVPVQEETPVYSFGTSKVTEDVDKSDKDSDRQECTCNSIHKDSRQDRVQWANGKSQEIVCVNVKSNLSKLSELKNPMCVNLDLHKGRGEGAENTRCLPLWVLLLPAFLALVGYYTFYYH